MSINRRALRSINWQAKINGAWHHRPDLQVALKDTDGIALSLTPLKAPEIAVAPRLLARQEVAGGLRVLLQRRDALLTIGVAAAFIAAGIAAAVQGLDPAARLVIRPRL